MQPLRVIVRMRADIKVISFDEAPNCLLWRQVLHPDTVLPAIRKISRWYVLNSAIRRAKERKQSPRHPREKNISKQSQ